MSQIVDKKVQHSEQQEETREDTPWAVHSGLKEAFLKQFEEREESIKNGAPSLFPKKKQAIQHLDQLGFPGHKHEEYKYTNVTKALKKTFNTLEDINKATDLPGIEKSDINLKDFVFNELDANVLIFVNGAFIKEESKIISQENELIIEEFGVACEKHPELVEKYYAKQADEKNEVSSSSDAFTALNTAFADHGAFIHVPKGTVVEKPVMLHFITDTSKGKVIAHTRNLIAVEESAEIQIAELYQSNEEEHAGYNNLVSEIIIAPNATVNYYKIQQEGEQIYHTENTQVYQSRDSKLNVTTVSLRGAMIRNNLSIILDDENCETNMYGLYLLKNKNHVDNHSAVDHKKPNSYSNELYKGIMDDKSKGVFNGKIFVRPDAQKTDAFQSNMNILLSDEATVDTKPQLEIWADDVRCSHGATTGQLDKEQLFYLRSRGLSERKAQAMLLYAFAADVLEDIKIEPLKGYLRTVISDRLEKEPKNYG